MRVRLAQQARADLDEIWFYIAQESGSQSTATRAIESIAHMFGLLAQFPFLGRALESMQRPQIRTFPAGNYLIFYQPKTDELRILRVIHASRDAFALFARE